MENLRSILLKSELTEELKWGKPCYTFQGSNVILIIGFKDHCALLFTKGALLQDVGGHLIRPTENTQSARQMRFTSVGETTGLEPSLRVYIEQAIAVEKAGLEVTYKKISDFAIPEELQNRLEADPSFKASFNALTPGRQRGYLLYFTAPKQSKTRASRIEKCLPRIFQGKGLHD